MEKKLDEFFSDERAKIDEIDTAMQNLFKERMELSLSVAKKKAKNGLPILDADREAQMTDRLMGNLDDNDLGSYYAEFIQKMLELSKKYQEKSIKNI